MKIKKFGIVLLTVFLVLIYSNLVLGEAENEDELFSSDETMVSEAEVVKDEVTEELNQKKLTLSGEVNTSSTYSKYDYENWIGPYQKDDFSNLIYSDLFFDYRMGNGFKSFLSLELSYFPEGEIEEKEKKTDWEIKEFFVDAHWQNKVYFRAGKQILKWGQGYFWNPSDLINIEKKDFNDMDKTREGTYGLKVHIPDGVKRNTYFFLGMEDASSINDLSLAAKYEFVTGGTEMSFSAWLKEDFHPVYGFDISGWWLDMAVRGEVSLVNGDNHPTLNYDTLTWEKKDGWIPRLCLGFTKNFDHKDILDRISITGEFYYNGAGYDENIFKRINSAGDILTKQLFMKDAYQSYQNSKYYLAFFSSVQKFIDTDLTLNMNGIMNLVDGSIHLSSGLIYHPSLKDYEFEFRVSRYLGDDFSEATLFGNSYSVYFGTKFLF